MYSVFWVVRLARGISPFVRLALPGDTSPQDTSPDQETSNCALQLYNYLSCLQRLSHLGTLALHGLFSLLNFMVMNEGDNLKSMIQKLPPEARKWAESLPWQHRRYVLSLCHLLLSASPETQAEFLDDYTADGLVSKMLEDRYTKNKVQRYLKQFQIRTNLREDILRSYIKQFYIHSAHDLRIQPDQYLESVLRLVLSVEEKNNVFNYILGFEIMKIMFNNTPDKIRRL